MHRSSDGKSAAGRFWASCSMRFAIHSPIRSNPLSWRPKPLFQAFLYAININESGSPSLADCGISTSCLWSKCSLSVGASASSAFGGLLFVGRSRYNDIVIADETVSRVHCIIVRSVGMVGVFDGWSSYGTLTLERGEKNKKCEESAVDDRRPLLFDEGESFTLRVGKHATIKFPG
mmetsp:Transcript_27632/g.82754  ORF Transcript_27632/g.82754 Transcript_27632/m.82754 type:complete len:176 (-) Transcript_27632:202-729(-)